MDHLPPPPIGLKYLVYFLCCLRPHKLWVAWAVEEMSWDRKEIEMGPPGLSGTLKKLPPQNWDLASMTSWHAASCKVLGMSRVIGIGPISYLGSCNFRKQCIVLWARNPSNWPPPTPPIRQTQLASFILGCILNRLRAIFRNMFSLFPLPLSLVFQSSAPNLHWLPTAIQNHRL